MRVSHSALIAFASFAFAAPSARADLHVFIRYLDVATLEDAPPTTVERAPHGDDTDVFVSTADPSSLFERLDVLRAGGEKIAKLVIQEGTDLELKIEQLYGLRGQLKDDVKVDVIRPDHDPKDYEERSRLLALDIRQGLNLVSPSITIQQPRTLALGITKSLVHAGFTLATAIFGVTVLAERGAIPFETLPAWIKMVGSFALLPLMPAEIVNLHLSVPANLHEFTFQDRLLARSRKSISFLRFLSREKLHAPVSH